MEANTIAKRNDALRASIPCIRHPDVLTLSAGVAALDGDTIGEVLIRVKQFNDFNPDNDPWHEHDFGAIEHRGQRFFFKIDNHKMHGGYRLILTVMLASEY